jgi:flagellar basal body rod protein FlgG
MERRAASRARPSGARFSHPILANLPGGIDIHQPEPRFGQGAIESTDRSLDIAVEGEGFFTVSDGDTTRYTRDGAMTLNAAGEIVLAAGGGRWRLLDEGGRTIRVDEAAGEVSVSQDGTVRQGRSIVGALRLVKPENPARLRKRGENLHAVPDGEAMVEANGRIVAEALEASNVDVMNGLASMMESSRAFQMNATLLQLQDQTVGLAVNTVGRRT